MTSEYSDRDAATASIEDAIRDLVDAYDLIEPDFQVTSWLIVLTTENPATPGVTGYAHSSSENLQPHSALGLLRVAEDHILNETNDIYDE